MDKSSGSENQKVNNKIHVYGIISELKQLIKLQRGIICLIMRF